jgi:hypothetical protein
MHVLERMPNPSDRPLLERAAAYPACHSTDELTPAALQQISERDGIDFATAVLYDRVLRRDSTRDLLALLNRDKTQPSPRKNLRIGVVPGAFYKEYAVTGADGQRVLDAAAKQGLRAERIPLHSFGSLADNARILCDWLTQHSDDEIVLVSLSKGGTDLQHALGLPEAAALFHKVALWINVSGIVQGTALANWLLGQTFRSLCVRVFAWWRGYPFHVLHQIRRAEKVDDATWPRHLRIVHLIGFPMRRHLHNPWAERAHRRLEPWGPNDGGGILLADAVRWPGTLIPLWGADHYLPEESCGVAPLIIRLLNVHGSGTRSMPDEIATAAAGG